MVLKNNFLEYPQVPNFDDEIIAMNDILFDVFYLGEKFEHTTLKNNEKIKLGDSSLQVVDEQLLINDEIQKNNKIIKNGDLIIKKHQDTLSITTALPREIVTISNDEKSAIRISKKCDLTILKEDDKFRVILTSGKSKIYFNGQMVTTLDEELNVGSQIVVAGVVIERRPEQLKITEIDGNYSINEILLPIESFKPEYPVDFPDFKRSPRILLTEPEEKVEVRNPATVNNSGKNDLIKTILPPVGMLAATFAMSFFSGRNPLMMMGMGGASLITVGISISSYFTNKKEHAQEMVTRKKDYQKYMVEISSRLEKLSRKQRQALDYHYPNMENLAEIVATYNHRIYEKTSNNADYLKFALGTGTIMSSYQVNMQYNEQLKDDPLAIYARENIVAPAKTLKNAPIITSLMEQTFGLVGTYPTLKNAVQTMLLQIATFHSYHDVEMILLVPEQAYEEDWSEWRWLPHFKMKELNLRGIVHNAQTKDMVLNSFYQLLNKRKQELRENSDKNIQFGVHYILTILDDSWLAGHGLNEFLAEDMSQYGVTVIFGKEDASMLSETVTTLINYDSIESAQLINENNKYVNKQFTPYKLPINYDSELLISRLANLNHLEVEKNAIPEAVTFLDMYKVRNVDQLNIEDRWQKANTSKSLSVPLGLRGKDDIVYLNLHERADGPHGLVAGTTGSGKSETVQSYLLSLAVNFAPEDVGFLPIDFKGGGMANLFKNLPHLLGSITNLDGASSARALASIRAELQKRQRLFGEFGVNHINGYTKLYKAGKEETDPKEKKKYPSKPLPHLFLVSDEFAELKANEPDFMAELVSTARIGRSLGVHLILATQKPSGVVDDQIWSNSRFKLALKVQDVADSNEILKTPDAASIVEPGRAYLQVGNNEVYELFQSAYSGGDYDPNQTIEEKIDERVWLINEYGQAELLTQDLSDEDTVTKVAKEEKVTQLDAVVEDIAEVAKETKAVLPDKPWLPPLKDKISTPEINFEEEWKKERDLSIPIGLMDIPNMQQQESFMFNFEKLNHTAIFSSPGFGKSTFLQTLVMNLAKKNTPEQLQFNLLDFSTNGLLPLEKLPHAADLVRLEDSEKLMKMLQRIRKDIETRKKDFQEAGVSTLVQFEQIKGEIPIIINVLDGYDAVTDSNSREEIDSVINKILREGSALGIYLIISANRSNSIRISMMSNIETKLALFLVDESEVADIIGRDRLIQQEIFGRGQVKLDQVNAFQTYLPNNEIEPLASLNKINEEVATIDQNWDGNRPQKLPVVPAEYSMDEFNLMNVVRELREVGNVPIGLALSNAEPVFMDVYKSNFFLVGYELETQRDMQRAVIIDQLSQLKKESAQTMLIDFENEIEQKENFDMLIKNEPSNIDKFKEISAKYVKASQEGNVLDRIYVYIADLESFLENINMRMDDLELVLNKAFKAGLIIIIHGEIEYVQGYDTKVSAVKNNIQSGIISARISDNNIISDIGRTTEPMLQNNEAYYFEAKGKKYTKIRIPGEID